jgi:hypothetical protein
MHIYITGDWKSSYSERNAYLAGGWEDSHPKRNAYKSWWLQSAVAVREMHI